MNSVLIRRLDSFSFSLLEQSKESISSTNITDGCLYNAIAKSVLTIFSPSPTHLLVKELAEMLKNVEFDSLAIALPIIVFPVPGGPKSSNPLGGALKPLKRSDRYLLITELII
jgi:hypothetical protein